jgi:hypothetical protein
MTLIVGSVTEDLGFLIGDTLLSFDITPSVQPIINQTHVLKIQVLNPDTAIAFAGNDADMALNLIYSLKAESSDEKLPEQLFRKLRASSGLDCEFLVLQLNDGKPSLNYINRSEFGARHRWYIGDQPEYARFTKAIESQTYTPPTAHFVQQTDGSFVEVPVSESDAEIYFIKARNAMESITSQWNARGSVGAICGGVTCVANAKISGKLEYMQTHLASISPAEGISGFSFFASNSRVRGTGVYYPLGKVGYLFLVGDVDYSRKEYAENAAQFIAMAKFKYGMNLQ